MSPSSRQVAEQATFQSFANCYLREVDAGVFTRHKAAAGSFEDCIEWVLSSQHLTLRAELTGHSLCGPHHFGKVRTRGAAETAWRPIEPLSAVLLLVHEAYRQRGGPCNETMRGFELELILRILESYQSTAAYGEAQSLGGPAKDSFIGAEQSLVFGHWLHPTPKSRQGMSFWHDPVYAPELRGTFRLHYFAAKADRVHDRSVHALSVSGIVDGLVGGDAARLAPRPGERLIPMHPLQANALLLRPEVQALIDGGALRFLGPAGPAFTATSSVRTVYNADQPFMLKFSLPVRITNSLRCNRAQELDAGVAMTTLFAKTGFATRYPAFRLIHDPAYITLDIPGLAESGFEVIFRENPFTAGRDKGITTIAALTADPIIGERSRLANIIRTLAAENAATVGETARTWFARYLEQAVEPLIRLYDEHGIALEAHQQNSLLDVSGGYPSSYYYRDNQGFYLSNRYRRELLSLAPETAEIPSLYYDDEEIRDRFAYYLIVNQVFSVISRMGHDGLCDETVLLGMLRRHLEHLAHTMTGAGRDFARSILERPSIAIKANLGARLLNIDELQSENLKSIYTRQPNPLFQRAAVLSGGEDRAIAS